VANDEFQVVSPSIDTNYTNRHRGRLGFLSDKLVATAKTYVDKYREDLNQRIMKRLETSKFNR